VRDGSGSLPNSAQSSTLRLGSQRSKRLVDDHRLDEVSDNQHPKAQQEDEHVVDAIKATGRTKIILSGLWNEVPWSCRRSRHRPKPTRSLIRRVRSGAMDSADSTR
jgi:hypothetical protein